MSVTNPIPNSDVPVPRGGTNDPPPKATPQGITLEDLAPEALEKILEQAKVSDQGRTFAREAMKYRVQKKALADELKELKGKGPDAKASEELAELRHHRALNTVLNSLDFVPGARADVAKWLSDITLLGADGSLQLLDEVSDTEIPANAETLKKVIPHDLLATRASGGSGQASIREISSQRPKVEQIISQASYEKMTREERIAYQKKLLSESGG